MSVNNKSSDDLDSDNEYDDFDDLETEFSESENETDYDSDDQKKIKNKKSDNEDDLINDDLDELDEMENITEITEIINDDVNDLVNNEEEENDEIIDDLEQKNRKMIKSVYKGTELDKIKIQRIKTRPNIEKFSKLFFSTLIMTSNNSQMLNSLEKKELSNGDWNNITHDTSCYAMACILSQCTPLVAFEGKENRQEVSFDDDYWRIILAKSLISDGQSFSLFSSKKLDELCPNILSNTRIYNNDNETLEKELQDIKKLKKYMIK